MLKHAVKMDTVVKFSAVASCASCLCRGQTSGLPAAVDQLIAFSGIGTTLLNLGGFGGPL
jgi:hypothetical protein